ncbi:MAG: DUF1080 domain-containing protein [Verrucomicrobiales bacterium]|nr:DUF1080 domain-containing protein [Verrucomicrobiales bacterium]
MRWNQLRPIALSLTLLAPLSWLATGCAECTQVILGKGDLSNIRPPLGAWVTAGDVKLDPANPKRFQILPGSGVIVNGADGRTVDILTTAEYGDLRVSYDFCIPKESNSGVYFMGRYEIQIFDSYGVTDPQHSDCGGIYQRWENDRGFEGHPPRVNACKAPGEWQHVEVVFRAPRFDASGHKTENARFKRVSLNGVAIHENVEVTGPTRSARYSDEQPYGPLMAQGDHGPVAFRNVRITPLHLP